MAYVQRIKVSMPKMKTDFDEVNWENKYHSPGYWKSVIESIQQCFLRSERTSKKTKESYFV